MRTLEGSGIVDQAAQALNWSVYRDDLTSITCGETQIFALLALKSNFIIMTIKHLFLCGHSR